MREIKFRAWNKIAKPARMKTWEQLCAQYQLTQVFTTDNEFFELMQHTGLKDKNGKDIYESDVIYYDNGIGIKGVVKWYEDGFALSIFGTGDASNIALHSITKDISIIGNVYENPELLKEGK